MQNVWRRFLSSLRKHCYIKNRFYSSVSIPKRHKLKVIMNFLHNEVLKRHIGLGFETVDTIYDKTLFFRKKNG